MLLLAFLWAASSLGAMRPTHPAREVGGLDTGGEGLVAVPVGQTGQPAPTRPYLGITYLPVNPKVAPQYGLAVDWGVLVTAVAEGSPAARAGIQPGDVLHEFEGQPLGEDVSLLDLLWHQQPGKTVKLMRWREGKHDTVEVVLGSR